MKKILLILICLPIVGFGQLTYIPDDNFEQELINLGYDDVLDNYILTDSILSITELHLDTNEILDFTGINEFSNLEDLSFHSSIATELNIDGLLNLKNLNSGISNFQKIELNNLPSLANINFSFNPLDTVIITNIDTILKLDINNYEYITEYLYINNVEVASTNFNQFLNVIDLNLINFTHNQENNGNTIVFENNFVKRINLENFVYLTDDLYYNGIRIRNCSNLKYVKVSNVNFNYDSQNDLGPSIIIWDNINLENLILSNCSSKTFSLSNSYTTNFIFDENFFQSIEIENINNIECLAFENKIDLESIFLSGLNNLSQLKFYNCPNFSNGNVSENNINCIEVDNLGLYEQSLQISSFANLSINCNYSDICSNTSTLNKYENNKRKLFKRFNLIGEEVRDVKNGPFIELYNDGSVEKKFIVE